ncbi:MAG: amidohydrolase [Phycisphaerales bacterium]|nr:amidohydrolase [Phycisphaerales bacterium]
MMTTRRLAVAALALIALLALPARAQPNLYFNANIYTMDPAQPRVDTMLVEDGLILAIGSNRGVQDSMRQQGIRVVRKIDMGGKTILPGLIDAHGHMISLGAIGLGVLDLRAAASYEDMVNIVRDRASHVPAGTWIIGRGWDNESWADKRLPHHGALSKAIPDNPVWLSRVDGHAGLANEKAMQLAGVSSAMTSPAGGEIVRDQNRLPTGLFVDNAESVISAVIPEGLTGTAEECILQAQKMCLAAGLTGVHDAGLSPDEVDTYLRLEASGALKIRVYGMVHAKEAPAYFAEHPPYDGFKLTVVSAKAYMDGAMGSRGAWLMAPYADRPTGPEGQPYTGLQVSQPAEIEALVRDGLAHNYTVCTHAIGDRANREVLNAYARAINDWQPVTPADATPRRYQWFTSADARLRVEHAQLLSFDDVPRFAAMGVIASMQPTHCTSDMRWVDARVGEERARGAYAWASLLKSGAHLAFGSDFPVESENPFLGIYAAVTRENLDGEPAGGFHPEQRVTREEALRAYTIEAAYAAFWDERVGSLEANKLADFIVIDRDVMTCDAREIADTKVLETYSYGELVYRAE